MENNGVESWLKLTHDKELLVKNVEEFLLSRGFCPASRHGNAKNSQNERLVRGVLRDDLEGKPRKRWFGFITERAPRIFLGIIWFRLAHGADKDNWIFDVHGRRNLELAKELAEKMSSEFKVKVTLNLKKDHKYECC